MAEEGDKDVDTYSNLFHDFKEQGEKRGLFDIYDLTSVRPSNGLKNYLQSWYRAATCIILQVLGPVWVTVYNVKSVIKTDDGHDWDNLCNGTFTSDNTFLDIVTKFMAAVVTLYEVAKIHKMLVRFQEKPSYKILINNKRFVAMKAPVWAYVGLISNYLCSIFCLIACIALTYEATSATNVILRAVTIFFLIDADNALLDMDEVAAMGKSLEDDAVVDFSIGSSLKLLNSFCLLFLQLVFWVGPTYMFVCKPAIQIT